jgi:hypothetical protein
MAHCDLRGCSERNDCGTRRMPTASVFRRIVPLPLDHISPVPQAWPPETERNLENRFIGDTESFHRFISFHELRLQ